MCFHVSKRKTRGDHKAEILFAHRYVCVSEGQAPGQAEEPRPALYPLYSDRMVYSRPAAVGVHG